MKRRTGLLLLFVLILCGGIVLSIFVAKEHTSSAPIILLPTAPAESAVPVWEDESFAAVTSIELDGKFYSINTVISMESLSRFKNLQELRIRNAEITDLHNLPKLRNLRHLELSNCSLQDVTSVGRLENLTTLNLSDNKITDISPLANMKYLFTLDLSGNNIQSLEPLEQLGLLQDLDLSLTSETVYSPRSTSREETGISSFGKYAVLDRLTALENLNLSYNGFSADVQLEFLCGMTRLKFLDLSGNDLKSIAFPESLSGLRELDVSDNLLCTLEGFESLAALEKLDISDNQLHSLEPISALKRLRILYLEADLFSGDEPAIESFEPLTELHLLEELTVNSADVPALECLIGNDMLKVEYFRSLFPSGWMSVEEAIRACEEYVPLTPETIPTPSADIPLPGTPEPAA